MNNNTTSYSILLIHIIILAYSTGYAQIDTFSVIENLIDDAIELDLGEGDMEIISEDLIERLSEREPGRPNLNNLSYEDAVKILKLTDFQYYQLQLYIEEYGEIYSIYEIPAIEGFDDSDMKRLAQSAKIEPPPRARKAFKEILASGRNTFWVRYGQILEKQAGYDTSRKSHYSGSPQHIVFRYEYRIGDKIGFKIAGGKEPGDCFFRGEQRYGFDHYSGSFHLNNFGMLKRAVVGDFRVNFGQGLAFGTSLLSGKGGGADGLRRFADGLRPVAITNEGNVFRGAGFTIGTSKINGTLYAGDITNSKNSGFGLSVKYTGKRLRIGGQLGGYGTIGDSTSKSVKWHALTHPDSFTGSLDYSLTAGKQLLFGEVAADHKGRIAILQSALLNLAPDLKLNVTFRHYPKNYKPVAASPFRALSLGCGETGLYLAASMVLSRKLEANVFADYFTTSWLSYRCDAPSRNLDFGFSIFCNINRNNLFSITYRYKNRQKNSTDDLYMHSILQKNEHRARLQWRSSPSKHLKLKTEASIALNKTENERLKTGFLIYQDAALTLYGDRFSLNLRAAYFDTDTYDERLYAYENDLYYAFNIGSYYYQGARWYLMVRYKVWKLSFWLRAGRVRYINKNTAGSGLNMIEKPHKTEIKAQILLKI